MSDDTPSPLNNVITIDDERIKSHLDFWTLPAPLSRESEGPQHSIDQLHNNKALNYW